MICDKLDCKNTATMKPILILKAHKNSSQNEVATMPMNLKVCDKCAVNDPEEYITDKGWQMIQDSFRDIRKMPPTRKYTAIKYEVI